MLKFTEEMHASGYVSVCACVRVRARACVCVCGGGYIGRICFVKNALYHIRDAVCKYADAGGSNVFCMRGAVQLLS
jgi:hypothetical protein